MYFKLDAWLTAHEMKNMEVKWNVLSNSTSGNCATNNNPEQPSVEFNPGQVALCNPLCDGKNKQTNKPNHFPEFEIFKMFFLN